MLRNHVKLQYFLFTGYVGRPLAKSHVGFSVQRLYWQAIRNHVNLQNFSFRGYAGRLSARNHANLHDFPFRGYVGRLSVRNHVNLQDSLSKGDADIYQRESCEVVAILDQRLLIQYIFWSFRP